MTNGPYCATDSPIGRPCISSTSTLPSSAVSVTGLSATTSIAADFDNALPSISSLGPEKKYSVRAVRAPFAGGTVHFAPGSSVISQIASSASGFAAHESGGGAGGCAPSSAPATSVTSTPAAGRTRGMSLSQSIVKYGAANFDFAGRLTQI